MENKVTKFGLRKMLAVLAIAFACVCMLGCSDDKFQWEHFGGAEVVGFVNDSLVMVGDYQNWVESHEGVFEPYWDVTGVGHERLCVYNYRVQENGPRWCGQLDDKNTTNAFRGQMTDSIVWGGDVPNSIRLWKVGETQHLINLKKITEGCSIEFGIGSVKQWLNGTFIARSDESLNAAGDSCQYAVLDTVARTLAYKRLGQDLEWIKKCDDVRAWGNDVYCILLDRKEGNSLVFKNENDTIHVPRKFAIGGFWGNMIKMSGNICSIDNDKITCSDIIWYGNELKFYQDEEVVAKY
jgi:hypothetical protein